MKKKEKKRLKISGNDQIWFLSLVLGNNKRINALDYTVILRKKNIFTMNG